MHAKFFLFLVITFTMSGCTNTITPDSLPAKTLVNKRNDENINVVQEDKDETDERTIDTSDWLTYTNEEYGFSIQYPGEAIHSSERQIIDVGSMKEALIFRVSDIDIRYISSSQYGYSDVLANDISFNVADAQAIQKVIIDDHEAIRIGASTPLGAPHYLLSYIIDYGRQGTYVLSSSYDKQNAEREAIIKTFHLL